MALVRVVFGTEKVCGNKFDRAYARACVCVCVKKNDHFCSNIIIK